DAPVINVTYRVFAPNGQLFRSADNGQYNVAVQPGQIFSTGNTDSVPGGAIGSFQVLTLSSGNGALPTASLGSLPTISSPSNTPFTFTVTYSSPFGLAASTIVNNSLAVFVVGPNGFGQLAQYVSIDNGSDGSPRTATYAFTPPPGGFSPANSGTYTFMTVS